MPRWRFNPPKQVISFMGKEYQSNFTEQAGISPRALAKRRAMRVRPMAL